MIYKESKKNDSHIVKNDDLQYIKNIDASRIGQGDFTIEDNETRYDIELENHGHFKCESCGTIYNFSTDIDSLQVEGLDDFKVNDRNVYYNGICPKCLSGMNPNVN